MTKEEFSKLSQPQREVLYKEMLKKILDKYSKEELTEYYNIHTREETCEHFDIINFKLLRKICDAIDYDFKYKKKHSAMKGKKTTRSHESYVAGGKKSGETQRKNWQNKSQEEKNAWSKKQSLAHLNSPTFKEKITISNRQYRESLTQEERDEQDRKRAESMRKWWDSFSEDKKQDEVNKRMSAGAGYHTHNSKPNQAFENLLISNNIQHEREFRIGQYSYDFKVDNILIEINPTVTHNVTWSPYGKPIDRRYHINKSKLAEDKGFRCIHIWDWDDPRKVISLLKKSDKIYARDCEVREVSKVDAQTFINEHHLQNYARDSIRLGLYYNNELISIMTFGKPRYNKNYEYELVRYCSSKNVLGGSDRLFKHFLEQYKPISVISYCDRSKFSGDTYIKLGFTLLNTGSLSKHWYNKKSKIHITDNLLRQQGFDRLFHTNFGKGTSNEQLMKDNFFLEVYDCGQSTYVYKTIDK